MARNAPALLRTTPAASAATKNTNVTTTATNKSRRSPSQHPAGEVPYGDGDEVFTYAEDLANYVHRNLGVPLL
jgi:hypothetical protein